MEDLATLSQLRELLLNASESTSTRVVAIVSSVSLAVAVLALVRRRALREEYTPIWMAVAAALMVLSFDTGLLRAITVAIGAWTYASTMYFLGEVFLVVICLNFAVRLSRASGQLKILGQEIALLHERLDRLGGGAPAAGELRESP